MVQQVQLARMALRVRMVKTAPLAQQGQPASQVRPDRLARTAPRAELA
jgi:hypothetical protein